MLGWRTQSFFHLRHKMLFDAREAVDRACDATRRRGNLAIRTSIREGRLYRRSLPRAILQDLLPDVLHNGGAHRCPRFYYSRRVARSRDSKASKTRANPTHDIVWSKVASYVSMTRRSLISQRYMRRDFSCRGDGRCVRARALFQRRTVCLYEPLRSD